MQFTFLPSALSIGTGTRLPSALGLSVSSHLTSPLSLQLPFVPFIYFHFLATKGH